MVQNNRPIPGTYADVPAALAAQAEAQHKWDCGQVVWATELDPTRSKRGEVCRSVA